MTNFNKRICFNINGPLCPTYGTQFKNFPLFFCLSPATPPAAENLCPGAEQKVVFITARVHPGETPSSFVCQVVVGMENWADPAKPRPACSPFVFQQEEWISPNSSSLRQQGIIDFLVSQHPIAKVLRDNLVFKIAPMLNPDGVYLGNYRVPEQDLPKVHWSQAHLEVTEGTSLFVFINDRRLSRCSLMGFDLNRHWANPSPWAHPTLHGVKQLIIEMYNNPVFKCFGLGIECLALASSEYGRSVETKQFLSLG
ncbi:Agbl4 [Columba guinea]|nr:Agbl4 [Columba guinea]